MQAQIVGVSFTDRAGHGAYVPLAHDYPDAPTQLKRDAVLEKLKPLLEADQPRKIGQNLKYDLNVLANHGVRLGGLGFEHHARILRARRHRLAPQRIHSRSSTSVTRRSRTKTSPARARTRSTSAKVPIDRASAYAAEDADITLRLHQALWPRLEETPALVKLFP